MHNIVNRPSPEEMIHTNTAAKKSAKRGRISDNVGDLASIVGTTADAVHLLLHHMARFAGNVAAAKSLDDVKTAAQPFAKLTADFVIDVEAGAVKLPCQTKGEGDVITEIGARATAVDTALTEVAAAFAPHEMALPKLSATTQPKGG